MLIATPPNPSQLGPYRCVRLLGQGAGGAVWLAHGPNGVSALKLAQTPEQRARILDEGALLKRLEHPCVVAAQDRDPTGLWVALEYVDGPTLRDWAVDKPLPALVELVRQVADCLVYLHQRGVVHGDLTPGNVLVDGRGSPKLIDLGAACVDDTPDRRRGFHATLGYSAPEVLAGARPSAASDIYSLGAILYTLLTDSPPFGEYDAAALGYLPLHSLPEPPSSRCARLPRQLDQLVLRMLARDPNMRPSGGGELLNALQRCLRSPVATPVIGARRQREALRRVLVEVLDGASSALVLHGRPGAGRRTLSNELTEAALREGVHVVEGAEDASALGLADPGEPLLLLAAMDTAGPLLATLSATPRSHTLLILLGPERVPQHLAPTAPRVVPEPFTASQVARLLQRSSQDMGLAVELHRVTQGHRGDVMRYLRNPDPSKLGYSEHERQLLEATAEEPVPLEVLARALKISCHDLVDLVEPLLDQGLLVEVDDGAALGRAVDG